MRSRKITRVRNKTRCRRKIKGGANIINEQVNSLRRKVDSLNSVIGPLKSQIKSLTNRLNATQRKLRECKPKPNILPFGDKDSSFGETNSSFVDKDSNNETYNLFHQLRDDNEVIKHADKKKNKNDQDYINDLLNALHDETDNETEEAK